MIHARQLCIGIVLFALLSIVGRENVRAQVPLGEKHSKDAETITKGPKPVVTGYGEGLFRIGKLLYRNDFETLDDWIVQIEESDAEAEPNVEAMGGTLHVLMPGRGATIWNRRKFSGPITIVYNVRAPTEHIDKEGIRVRDMNCFWHASDPGRSGDLLNPNRYTGAFGTYHKQQGYYASMGGRNNTTTRFRRYPRTADGEPVDHLALSDKDGLEVFLIEPGKTHTIQLVAYKDVIQYIVDGRVFYEIREGDTVTVARADGGKEEVVYRKKRFPPYGEGWFGFRLVRSHHVYSNFRVYRLEPFER